MDFKETFLKLTEYTIPHGEEDTLVSHLPSAIKKDKWGNYFISIGKSRTLFTCHLDTYCENKEKVNHIVDGNIIRTDGTTILGGDNKAGMTVLLYMIEKNVPGTYYFFLSEEPISTNGGLWGSSNLLYGNPNFLKQFDRAVAFDRKHYGSIITRQMAQKCCSEEFADSLIDEFKKQGIQMDQDKNGYYTDTGNFIELIPECTNISVGVWYEHHAEEYVDIEYVEKIAKAACKIDWENLPIVREVGSWIKDEKDPKEKTRLKKYQNFSNSNKDEDIFKEINKLLTDIDDYVLMNKSPFKPGKEMWYNKWFEEDPIKVVVLNGKIKIDDEDVKFRDIKRQYL